MTDLPAPLTPPDCDLRDFPFMPLHVARLKKSRAWLVAKRQPELAFYMVNLWTAAWHERPAGSLENDDDVLCDLAMCSPRRWSKVCEKVMRGWTLCVDNRWYHPTVCEEVLSSFEKKKKRQKRSAAGNDARWGDNREKSITSESDKDRDRIPTDVLVDPKGQGHREGEVRKKESPRTVPLAQTVAGAPPASSSLFGEAASPTPPQPARGPKVTTARTRVPSDWKPDDAGLTFARERGVDLTTEPQRFIDHHQAKGSLMADWRAAWRTWCGMAVQFGRAAGKPADKPENPNAWNQAGMTGFA